MIIFTNARSISKAQRLKLTTGGVSGENFHHEISGQRVHDHDVRGSFQKIVSSHDDSAIRARRFGERYLISLFC